MLLASARLARFVSSCGAGLATVTQSFCLLLFPLVVEDAICSLLWSTSTVDLEYEVKVRRI